MARRSSHLNGFEPHERFSGLLERLGLESCFENAYPALVNHYSEGERHYHNLDHIDHCLGRLDEVGGYLHDPDAAELALWFHDVVYDPGARDNELRSAFLFDRLLGIHLPTQRADRVHAMIMATVHPSDADDHDSRFVADIDLSGFALPRAEFLNTTTLLRRECRHLTDAQFQLGTLAFFRKLLSRPSIYLTEYFQTNHERDARRNVLGLTRQLEGREIP